jgi:hypothetical protein
MFADKTKAAIQFAAYGFGLVVQVAVIGSSSLQAAPQPQTE